MKDESTTISVRISKKRYKELEQSVILESSKRNQIVTVSDYIRELLELGISGSLEK